MSRGKSYEAGREPIRNPDNKYFEAAIMRKNNFLTRIIAAVLTAVILAAVPQITSQASPKKMSDGGIFDAEYYAEQNPDVVAAVGTSEAALYNHYETVGKSEGRLPYASASASDTSKHSAKEQAVYNAMMAMQSKFPEGMTWTNANGYAWKGGIYSIGYGCAGFAFALSDAAFGNAKATKVYNTDSIRVGDIIRMDNNTHMVIVLSTNADGVIVAEGNYNGRFISWAEVSTADWVLTRY